MNSTKYIIVTDNPDHGIERFIMFDAGINHNDMAKAMERLRFPHVLAAGFVNEFMDCYGESMTLRLKSRGEEDTYRLHAMTDLDDKEVIFKRDGCDKCNNGVFASKGNNFCSQCGTPLKRK